MIFISDEQIGFFLKELQEQHGYDFTNYSKVSMKRRIKRLMLLDRFMDFEKFSAKTFSNTQYVQRFVDEVTVNVTEMFRDSAFYNDLRRDVLPTLDKHPLIRIWHAGCSTGEEAYSMAILLQEAGMLHKTIIYATDINSDVLEKARHGVFPKRKVKLYSDNYISGGGLGDFSSYYSINVEGIKFNHSLCKKIIFSTHNLVSDNVFNEFHLIVCRNVLIYFDKDLREKVFSLFDASMEKMSYLALGSKETLKCSNIYRKYRQISHEKIWRKLK